MLDKIFGNRDKQVASLQYSQIARAGSVFLVSVFLTKIFDDVTVITQYETLLLIGGSFTFFWVSALLTVFLPFYHAAEEDKKKVIIFNSFLLISVLSVLAFIAILLFAGYFFTLVDRTLLFYFALYILFNSPSFFTEYLFLIRGKTRAVIVYATVFYSLHVLAVCLPLFAGKPLVVSVKLLAILAFVKYLVSILYVVRYGKPGFDRQLTRQYGLRSLPITLSFLVGGAAEYIDGFIVRYFSDNTGFALFRYGARELPLTLLFANALSNVMSGKVASALGKGQPLDEILSGLKKSSLRLMHFLFPATILLLIFSPFLFEWVYNTTFQPAYRVFNLFLLLIVSRLIFPHSIVLGMQKNNVILWTSLMASIMNVALSVWLIQKSGIVGVAYATIIAHYFHKAIMIFIVNQKQIGAQKYIPIGWWVSYSFVSWVVYLLV